jgi:peptidoglycan/LPS O-acetylase OafA/YrhL
MASIETARPAQQAHARNPALDALRFVAISSVVMCHLFFSPQLVFPASLHWLAEVIDFGGRGVDLFFALSGYLIGGIAFSAYEKNARFPVLAFWRDRWMRTVPAYWVTLALYFIKGVLLPHKSTGLGSPLAYLVFLQSYVVAHSLPDFAHSWSLAVEEHFYLVLPLILLASSALLAASSKSLVKFFAGLFVVTLVVRAVLSVKGFQVHERLSHFRTDALLLGVIIAGLERTKSDLYARVKSLHRPLFVLSLTLVLVAMVIQLSGLPWQTVVALVSALLVVLGAQREANMAKFGSFTVVAWVSRISYSLYLLHPIALSFGDAAAKKLAGNSFALTLLIRCCAIGGALVLAELSYRLIETPFLNLRNRWRERATNSA